MKTKDGILKVVVLIGIFIASCDSVKVGKNACTPISSEMEKTIFHQPIGSDTVNRNQLREELDHLLREQFHPSFLEKHPLASLMLFFTQSGDVCILIYSGSNADLPRQKECFGGQTSIVSCCENYFDAHSDGCLTITYYKGNYTVTSGDCYTTNTCREERSRIGCINALLFLFPPFG